MHGENLKLREERIWRAEGRL